MAKEPKKPTIKGLKNPDTILARVREYPELAIEAFEHMLLLSFTPKGMSEQSYSLFLSNFIEEYPEVVDKAIEMTTHPDYAERWRLSASDVGMAYPESAPRIIDRLARDGGPTQKDIYNIERLGRNIPNFAEQAIETLGKCAGDNINRAVDAIWAVADTNKTLIPVAVKAALRFEDTTRSVFDFIKKIPIYDSGYGRSKQLDAATQAFEIITQKKDSKKVREDMLKAAKLFPHLTHRAFDVLNGREGVDMPDVIKQLDLGDDSKLREKALDTLMSLEQSDEIVDMIANISWKAPNAEKVIEHLAKLPPRDVVTKAIGQVGRYGNLYERAIEVLEGIEGAVATKAIKDIAGIGTSVKGQAVFDALVRRGDFEEAKFVALNGGSHLGSLKYAFRIVASCEAVAGISEEQRGELSEIASEAFSDVFSDVHDFTRNADARSIASLGDVLVRAAEIGNPLGLDLPAMKQKVATAQGFFAMFERK